VDIDESLIRELQIEKELLETRYNNNILFDIKSKKFISADDKTITCNLNVEGTTRILPNLIVQNNAVIRQGVFNFQNNHNGCLRATFTEDTTKIELDCYSPFFKGNLIHANLNRIIQFPKIDLEQNPHKISQWEQLDQPLRKVTALDEIIFNKFTTITQKYFWINCEPSGFIVCGINAAEKTIVFSTKDIKNRIIANIDNTKKSKISIICSIWPELKPYLEITDKGLILSFNKINLYLPVIDTNDTIKDGVYRITKHHHSDQVHAFLTHINCC